MQEVVGVGLCPLSDLWRFRQEVVFRGQLLNNFGSDGAKTEI